MSTNPIAPTPVDPVKQAAEDRTLIAFADSCEAFNFKNSLYYRLYPQIEMARDRAKKKAQGL